MKPMKVLLTGGGTAGHINPALAIADYITKHDKDAKILYVGAKGNMEQRLVKAAGYDFEAIEISGFSRKISLEGVKKNIKTAGLILTSSRRAKEILHKFKPDICIGTGGYVSGPVVRQAQKQNIPTLIHEQNAYPGVTTKMLSKKAKCVMLAVPQAEEYLGSGCKIKVTGNPVREQIKSFGSDCARRELGLDSRPVILSFGGSLGARKINEAVAEFIASTAKTNKYQYIHAYGQYGKWFPDKLQSKGVNLNEHKNLDIREYIDDMPRCLVAADLVICRAGAITLSEIEAAAKVSILIPSPNVAENHQYYNAMALVNNKAALILEESDLSGAKLKEMATSLLDNSTLMEEYGGNAGKMAVTDSNERIYKIIKQTLR